MGRTLERPRVPLLPLRAAHGVALGLAVLAAATVSAQTITNGGFESGPLGGVPTGWTAGGTQQVEVLQLSNFVVSSGTNNITIPEGSYLVALSTGPGDQGGSTARIDGNTTNEDDIATLSQTFDAGAGGTIVGFNWALLTSEANEDLVYDDLFTVDLDGVPVLTGSVNKPGGISDFPDTPAWNPATGQSYDGTGYTIQSSGAVDNSSFVRTPNDGFSGWNSFSFVVPPGSHTLRFRVADQGDNAFDSALLIDNVRTVGGQNLFQLTSTSGSQVEAKVGGIVWRPHQTTGVAIADGAGTIGFLSTGPFDGNGNAQQQVMVSTSAGTSYERLTTMVDGAASRPALSADGALVTYAAADNPTPPANDDLNQEIFLRNRSTSSTTQITQTTGCTSSNPSLGGATTRIAFQSTCAGLPGAPNSNGNSEIVVWTQGSGLRSIVDTAATCSSRDPQISADGRFVAFLSSCNFTGGNADGSFEIFRWDLTTNAVQQVTSVTIPAILVDGSSISGDGSRIALISNGDLDGAGAALPTYEAFLWTATGPAFYQLTTSTFELNLVARIEDSGNFVALEQLDLLGGDSKILLLGVTDPTNPGIQPIAIGSTVALADIGRDRSAGEAVVVFQAQDDLVAGGNGDGNWELYTSRLTAQVPPQTFCSSPDVAIPNNNTTGVSDTITVPDIGAVTDVNVYLRINHTYVGDLEVRLRNATVANRLLLDRPLNGTGSCTRDNIDAFLDDEGARPVNAECPNQTPTILSPPSFIPNLDGGLRLDAFDGSNAQGPWTLNVRDRRNQNTGTLIQWCVAISVE